MFYFPRLSSPGQRVGEHLLDSGRVTSGFAFAHVPGGESCLGSTHQNVRMRGVDHFEWVYIVPILNTPNNPEIALFGDFTVLNMVIQSTAFNTLLTQHESDL